MGSMSSARAGSSAAAAFHGIEVAGAPSVRLLRLRDSQGQQRQMADFRGKLVALFFGFTQCADVCPGELSRLSKLLGSLGDEASKVQVLFVTLDPERDTAAILGGYVNAFDRRIVALRGNSADTAAAAREFRVYFRKIEGSRPGRYTIDHSSYVYLVDPGGRLRLKIGPEEPIEQIAEDVRSLLIPRNN